MPQFQYFHFWFLVLLASFNIQKCQGVDDELKHDNRLETPEAKGNLEEISKQEHSSNKMTTGSHASSVSQQSILNEVLSRSSNSGIIKQEMAEADSYHNFKNGYLHNDLPGAMEDSNKKKSKIAEADDTKQSLDKQTVRGKGVEFFKEHYDYPQRADLIVEGKKNIIRPQLSRIKARYPTSFCELQRDSGVICPGIRRGLYVEQFFYDLDTNRCYHFVYNGCGGNANRFSSMWECSQSCAYQKTEGAHDE